jgi:hypothetical protein
MSYDLRGIFVEACDCNVVCPCWFDDDPDDGECTGTLAWHVEQGEVDGVDVSGLTAVSISYHRGNRHDGRWRVALFVDERATAEQERALADVFTGKKGGPLTELAKLTGEVTAVLRVPIKLTHNDGGTTLTAGKAVKVALKPLIGATDRITTLADSALAVTLGTPAEVGRSSSYKLDLQGEGFDLNLRGRSANRGRFSYVMTGRARKASTPAVHG